MAIKAVVLFVSVFFAGCVAVPAYPPGTRMVYVPAGTPVPIPVVSNQAPALPQAPGGPQLSQPQTTVYVPVAPPVYYYPAPMYYYPHPSFYIRWGSGRGAFMYRGWH
jgi:hypothetical protein